MTEAYAPPEKFSSKREDRKPDRKGDIFSFGISLYELACGNLPFDDLSTGRELLHSDVEVDFSEIKNEKLKRIIQLCMQPDKDSRPSAAELLNMVKSENMPEDKKLLGMENIRYGLGIIKQYDKTLLVSLSLVILEEDCIA